MIFVKSLSELLPVQHVVRIHVHPSLLGLANYLSSSRDVNNTLKTKDTKPESQLPVLRCHLVGILANGSQELGRQDFYKCEQRDAVLKRTAG